MSENKVSKETITKKILDVLKEVDPNKIVKETSNYGEKYVVSLPKGEITIRKNINYNVSSIPFYDIYISDAEKEKPTDLSEFLLIDSRVFDFAGEIVYWRDKKQSELEDFSNRLSSVL